MTTVDAIYALMLFQLSILPFQLALWYAHWQENKRTRRLLAACLRSLGVLTIIRGKSNLL